jgi:hypothetical protein
MTIDIGDIIYLGSEGSWDAGYGNLPNNLGATTSTSYEVLSGHINNVFDDITYDESVAGYTCYRCLYVYNNSSDTVYDVKVWIETPPININTSMEIGADSRPVLPSSAGGFTAYPMPEETGSIFNGATYQWSQGSAVPYSVDVSNAAWTKVNTTITTGYSDMSYSQGAQGLVASAASADHYIHDDITFVPSADIPGVISVYAAPSAKSWIMIQGYSTTLLDTFRGWFDLDNEVAGTMGSAVYHYGVVPDYINGYSRVFISCLDVQSVATVNLRIYSAEQDAATTYTGDGSSTDIVVHCPQFDTYDVYPALREITGLTGNGKRLDYIKYTSSSYSNAAHLDFDILLWGDTPHRGIFDATILSMYKQTPTTQDVVFMVTEGDGFAQLYVDHPDLPDAYITDNVNLFDGRPHNIRIEFRASSYVSLTVDGRLAGRVAMSSSTAFAMEVLVLEPTFRAYTIRDLYVSDANMESAGGGLNLYTSGISMINTSASINGHSQTPTVRYEGNDATTTDWPAVTYGGTLAVTGSGAEPEAGTVAYGYDQQATAGRTAGTLSPTNKYWALNQSIIGTGDFFVVAIVKLPPGTPSNTKLLGDWSGTVGFYFELTTSYTLRFVADDGVTTSTSTALDMTESRGAWVFMAAWGNRDETSSNGLGLYANGVTAAAVGLGATGTLNGSNTFIGDGYAASAQYAFFAAYEYSNWFQAGATGYTECADYARDWHNTYMGETDESLITTHAHSYTGNVERYDMATGEKIIVPCGKGMLMRSTTEIPSGPAGTKFTTATEELPLLLAEELPPGHHRAFWLRRETRAGRGETINDGCIVRTTVNDRRL